MTTSPSPAAKTNLICQRLKARDIQAIAFIDDAYDPFSAAEVTDIQIGEFWAALQSRDADGMRKEFDEFNNAEFQGAVSSQAEIDNDVLVKLWEMREKFEALKEPLSHLFATKLKNRNQLDRIVSLIRSQCSVDDESVLQIKTLDSRQNVIPELEDTKIVFIDYYLGAGGDQESKQKAIDRANEITTEIYKHYAPKLPLVILMSSAPEVKAQQEQFRRDKGWLIGLFYCVTKDDLEDPEKLGINFGTWIERLEQGTKIQQFVETVEKSLKSAVDGFINSVRNLSLEDYAYVQDLSLAPNGQPLGEYMVWLFNAYLGRLAFETDKDVLKHQDIISGFSFDRLPLSQFMPSVDLIEMYDSALFNKAIGDLTHHPADPGFSGSAAAEEKSSIPLAPNVADRAEAEIVGDASHPPVEIRTDLDAEQVSADTSELLEGAEASQADGGHSEHPVIPDIITGTVKGDSGKGKGSAVSGTMALTCPWTAGNEDQKNSSALPYLRLGLIFVKDPSSEIWMVLNADCDLAYTPDGKRQPIRVVALIAGQLEEMKKTTTALTEPKTDLFRWNESTYHIRWQVKSVAFQEFKQLLERCAKLGYKPFAILRLPYALEVQRAYATHFTRIGLPVAPPIHHYVNVEILRKDAEGKIVELLSPQADLAFLTTIRDTIGGEGKTQLRSRFTTQFGYQLKRATTNLSGIFQQDADALGNGDDKATVNKRKKIESGIARLTKLLTDFDELFLKNPSPDLTGKDNAKPVQLYSGKDEIGICRNLKKDDFDNWGNHFLIVNLIDPDLIEESIAIQGEASIE
jgi:hypothetical protein